MSKILHGLKPVVRDDSRILILGSMPGPEALRLREYYGFKGNHFWRILADLFIPGSEQGRIDHSRMAYTEKLALLHENHIALWDVIGSCERRGASDSAIRNVKPNDIPKLLKRYPGIRVIFLNGRAAERLFYAHFASSTTIPARYLPSTSPACAAIGYSKKLKQWRIILNSLENRNCWC